MPNCSSSSVNTVDWAMGMDGCYTVKKRNLLDNLQVFPDHVSSTPTPPPFQDFITLVNTKKRTHTSLSVSSNGSDSDNLSLPHQTPSPLLDHSNYKYAKIRARPLYNFKYTESSIWTQSSINSTDSLMNNSLFDINLVNKFFAKETKQNNNNSNNEQRARTSSISTIITRPFQILDKSLQITYDVTMRHLIQLLGKNATIDDVLSGIDTGHIDNEWLQCIQRLNKQFLKRPEEKLKFETYNMANIDQLNLVEQFLLKLIRIPNYNFKLKCYQYRDEFQSQLNLLNQSIDRFLNGINLILNDKFLPRIFQLLCYLYNSLSNKCVPGLDFISLLDALNSPTNQLNKTVAHVLAEILNQYYHHEFLNLINNEDLIELKKVFTIKYEKIFTEIREIYQYYQQLEYEYVSLIKNQYEFPLSIQSIFKKTKIEFEKFFQQEYIIKKGEQDLANYFCSNDLSIDICLSTIGQIIDKLRLAHLENNREQKRKLSVTDYPRKYSVSSLTNSTSSLLSYI